MYGSGNDRVRVSERGKGSAKGVRVSERGKGQRKGLGADLRRKKTR